MKTRRHPRGRKSAKVLMLTRTLCPECGASWSGAELLADADQCPDCRRRADPERGEAKFAPAKRAPLTGEPETG